MRGHANQASGQTLLLPYGCIALVALVFLYEYEIPTHKVVVDWWSPMWHFVPRISYSALSSSALHSMRQLPLIHVGNA